MVIQTSPANFKIKRALAFQTSSRICLREMTKRFIRESLAACQCKMQIIAKLYRRVGKLMYIELMKMVLIISLSFDSKILLYLIFDMLKSITSVCHTISYSPSDRHAARHIQLVSVWHAKHCPTQLKLQCVTHSQCVADPLANATNTTESVRCDPIEFDLEFGFS